MERITANDPESHSADVVAQNLSQLKAIFPDVFCEGKIDFDVLRQLLGDAIDEGDEKYGLDWHGKGQARRLALTPSAGTLRPCPEESVDWDTTQNLMIEGDNLEVLKLLQKSYAGKVKLIYIDPPYNTGKDFIYPDNYKDGIKNYLKLTGQVDGNGQKLTSNTDASGRFHTNWLNMMYPRLKLARNLLRQDGAMLISSDDGEVDGLRQICSEIFGDENFVTMIVWQKKYAPSNDAKWFSDNHDYLVLYARSKELWRPNLLPRTDAANARYKNPDNDPRGRWKPGGLDVKTYSPQYDYEITTPGGRVVRPPSGACWRVAKERFNELVSDGRIYFGKSGNNVPAIKRFLSEVKDGITPLTIWPYNEVGHNQEATKEVRELGVLGCESPKPIRLLKRVIEIGSDRDSIILDFFAGSGTFGHAAMIQNSVDGGCRRAISVQIPQQLDEKKSLHRIAITFCDSLGVSRNLAELMKERLRRGGIKVKEESPQFKGDIGFRVFKLDSTNIKEWDPRRADIQQALLDHVDNIKEDRSADDLLYEIMLKLGFDLCAPAQSRSIAGKSVHAIAGGALIACMDARIGNADAEDLAIGISEWICELENTDDTTVVFRDSAFDDDVSKTNVTEILRQAGVKNVRSI